VIGRLSARVRRRRATSDSAYLEAPETAQHARKAASGMTWAFVGMGGQQVMSLIVTFFLAGLLGPRSFGLVAMAMIYIQFVQLALDQGISTAIVQRKDLEIAHLDSAFWMNLLWACLLAGVSIGLAGWWADLNRQPELKPIIITLSLLLPIQGLIIVQESLLQREMNFKKLAFRGNLAAVVGGVVGVATALAGAGVWALVAQQLTGAVASLLTLWTVSRWLPRFRFSGRHAKELLSFSTQVFTGNLAVFASRRVDALMIGLFFGPIPVGLYRLADRLVETLLTFSTRPLQMFSLAHLARLQHDRDAFRDGVRTCMRLSTFATVPLMLGLAACAPYVIHSLGGQWSPATNALRLLALTGIGKAAIVFTAATLFAAGKPRLRAISEWSLAAVSAATFAGAALILRGTSTSHQVVGMAASRLVLFIVVFLPVNLLLVKITAHIKIRSLLRPTLWPAVAGFAAIAAVIGAEQVGILSHSHPVFSLLASGAIASLSAAVVLIVLDDEVRGFLIRLRHRGMGPPPTPEPAGAQPQ
jgi:PST family polysaccharide transporter